MKINNIWQMVRQWRHTVDAICLLLLVTFTLGIFINSVHIRQPWRGNLNQFTYHQWLTGSTVKFAENWYRDGALADSFGLFENPSSFEFPTLADRDAYASYPPGTILPIYALGLLTHHQPTPSLVMKYNLLNQLGIALALAATLFLFLRSIQVSSLSSLLLSGIAPFIELNLPGTLYWHQNVFFSDQAVLLPIALLILSEVLLWNSSSLTFKRIIYIAQMLLLFYASLTDWLAIFVAVALFVVKIVRGEIQLQPLLGFVKKSLYFWLPVVAAVFLYIWQLWQLNIINLAIDRYLQRSGISQSGQELVTNFYQQFWVGHMQLSFGPWSTNLIVVSALLFSVITIAVITMRRLGRLDDSLTDHLLLIGLLMVPCLIQVYAFQNHSVVHHFSVLKFSLILTTIPFVLLPLLLLRLFKMNLNRIAIEGIFFRIQQYRLAISIPLISLGLCLWAFMYISPMSSYKLAMFEQPEVNIKIEGESIRRQARYDDIFFSPDFTIPANPPQYLAYSGKLVYQADSAEDMVKQLQKMPQPERIIIAFRHNPSQDQLDNFNQPTFLMHDVFYYYTFD